MSRVVVVHDLIDLLPFHEALSWEKFQTLCTDVLYKRFNSIDSREYLRKGDAQQGIDVYTIKRVGEKMTVAQCKLVEYLGPKQVDDIINEFLKGSLVDETKEFILCTSADLGRQRDEEKTIADARRKLAIHGIDLIVWDERGLSTVLRTDDTPAIINIVYRYFGEEIAQYFYGKVWLEYLKKLIPVRKQQYTSQQDYIERRTISYNDQIDNKKSNEWNFWEEEQRETLIEIIEKNAGRSSKNIVLLSTAGYGKTEELRNIAAYFSDEKKILFPITFSLLDYIGQTINDILSNSVPDWINIPEENILLLFDGLDEIGESHSQEFTKQLNAFIEQHSLVQTVVSSRYNFYDVRYPQLREFEIFLLYPLNSQDIENYLVKKLGNLKDDFERLLQEQNFSEHVENPYYLTRLVRFYNQPDIPFPKTKTELFNRVLFEQLEKDSDKHNLPELKEKILPFARQIAFCMTLAGKSALTDEEIKTIIPEPEIRKLLNHFAIINRNKTNLGLWSFEHKNLQEYLSASVFSKSTFSDLLKFISFKHNTKKLLPRFLNTISFLFELIDKKSQLFRDLFEWININEPELLVRFEKEQLSKDTRHDIFKRIFYYYKEKQITMRVSSNFSNEELGRFVEIDNEIIDFFTKELEAEITSTLAYDTLSILGSCKRPFIYGDKLNHLLFSLLGSEHYEDYVQGKTITTFVSLGFNDFSNFEKILKSRIDLNNLEIRDSCIYYLNSNTNFYEDYSDFILESIKVFEEGYKKKSSFGSFFSLKQIILKFHTPKKIKQIFQYCVSDKNCIKRNSPYREFHFDFNEVKTLLESAIEAYKTDPKILPLVYRLFCGMEYISVDQNWFAIFKSFFENTCGTAIIFKKFYRYRKYDRDFMSFADQEACDFLIEEYGNGNIEDKEFGIIRNKLSWINQGLFVPFYEKIKIFGTGQFIIEDIMVDYNEVNKTQKEKNQQILLDRNLFKEEAKRIFSIIAKDKITTSDLWYSTTIELRIYQSSIVMDAIRKMCIDNNDHLISQEEFFAKYTNDDEWEGFVIDSIVELIKDKGITIIHPELILIIQKWCKIKIQVLDFENSIKDVGDSFRYIPIVEFVKDVFLLLDIDLNDELLLKMVASDYESFYSWKDDTTKTILSVVSEKINNKELLRDTILTNIKDENLAILVLCSHFTICWKLGYRECLPDLYKTIILNPLVKNHNRITLTEYYLDIGGVITDFISHLSIPDVKEEADLYSSWQWFLIEKLQFIVSDRVTEILLQILSDPNQTLNKLKAAEHLIELLRIEGLEYWGNYVREKGVIPFEHKWSSLQKYIVDLPSKKAIDIFCSTFEFCYKNNFQNKFSGSHFIEESIFNSLITISKKDYKYYEIIKNRIEKMITDFSKSSYVDSLRFYSERLTQRFYESQTQEMNILSANLIYNSISNNNI